MEACEGVDVSVHHSAAREVRVGEVDDAVGVAGCEVEEGLVGWECGDEGVLESCGVYIIIIVEFVAVAAVLLMLFLLLLGAGR